MTDTRNPIAVFYEHPEWFAPLFEELESRRIPHVRAYARQHSFDPGAGAPDWALLYNRMSPSAWLRGLPGVVEYTRAWLAHLERRGLRVVNGVRAFDVEASKARQLSLLDELGLPYPASRVLHRPEHAPAAAGELRFPVVVKPNLGGSGAGIRRFETPDDLRGAVERDEVDLGPDGTGLVQEYVPPRDGRIVRVEVLGGEFLYAIRVRADAGCYDLCPADLDDAASENGAEPSVEAHRPSDWLAFQVERIARAAGMEVGGVEYLVDDRDGTVRFYDVNANSNFVADAERVVGFDPFVRLVEFLEREAYGGSADAGAAGAAPAAGERSLERV